MCFISFVKQKHNPEMFLNYLEKQYFLKEDLRLSLFVCNSYNWIYITLGKLIN